MIRVLVAEDSTTARELLIEILNSDPEIEVIGAVGNGEDAVEQARALRPDLIVMDVHMPVMDGLEATKEIMIRVPTPIVIVSSSVDKRQIELSLSATQAGALIALPKPASPGSPRFDELSDQLLRMVKAMARVKVVRHWGASRRRRTPLAPHRPAAGVAARVVPVAASTGGPAALRRILMDLPRDFGAPILIVQHIARGFATGFTEWLASGCALPVKLAEAGEPLQAPIVYVAPDSYHLGVAGNNRVKLAETPPIGGFRPSASYLFESTARAYGAAVAAVVLTGMGSDGVEGLHAVREIGGRVIAQDEASSVVFGMAQEAIRSGLVDEVLSLDEIAPRLVECVGAGEHG